MAAKIVSSRCSSLATTSGARSAIRAASSADLGLFGWRDKQVMGIGQSQTKVHSKWGRMATTAVGWALHCMRSMLISERGGRRYNCVNSQPNGSTTPCGSMRSGTRCLMPYISRYAQPPATELAKTCVFGKRD